MLTLHLPFAFYFFRNRTHQKVTGKAPWPIWNITTALNYDRFQNELVVEYTDVVHNLNWYANEVLRLDHFYQVNPSRHWSQILPNQYYCPCEFTLNIVANIWGTMHSVELAIFPQNTLVAFFFLLGKCTWLPILDLEAHASIRHIVDFNSLLAN